MYIIAIAWLYVTLLMAFTEPNIVAGLATFIFYGLIPMSLVLWLGGTKMRRQRQRHRQLLADQRANDNNRSDTQADQ